MTIKTRLTPSPHAFHNILYIHYHDANLLVLIISDYLDSIETHLKREDWYMWANMKKGTVTLPVFQSLEAFWPGMLVSLATIDLARTFIESEFVHCMVSSSYLGCIYFVMNVLDGAAL